MRSGPGDDDPLPMLIMSRSGFTRVSHSSTQALGRPASYTSRVSPSWRSSFPAASACGLLGAPRGPRRSGANAGGPIRLQRNARAAHSPAAAETDRPIMRTTLRRNPPLPARRLSVSDDLAS